MARLVIVAPNWLGDAVMALPAIADIRKALPGTAVAVVAKPAVASLFTMVSDVDEVIAKGTRPSADIGLLLPNSFRSALDLARAGVPQRWGYRSDCRGPLLTRAVERPAAGLHQVEYYQHLVHALGFVSGPAQPRLEMTPEIRAAGARALAAAGWDGTGSLVALAPGGAYGGAKRWPPEYFAALARELASDGLRTVIVGTAADERTRGEIAAALGPDAAAHIDLVGRTDVPALAGVLSHVRALVANDSGVVHLAAALGVPTVTLFGPMDERLTAPRSASAHTVLAHPVWCRPCMLRECPLDHSCMRGISTAAAAAAARQML
ncbi:MAG: lipopolysaccharide heptosyltransferase II [Acidobacteriota bacterium]